MTNKQIGDFGEAKASEYLKLKNYKIIKRNYRVRNGEIDIIAKSEHGTVVFAEVKTRNSTEYGSGAEFVDYHKQERIKQTALCFTGRDDIDMRFDVIEIYYELVNKQIIITEINHIENAF